MASRKPETGSNRRKKWKVRSHYDQRFPGEYSTDQLTALTEAAQKRGANIIDLIREAIDDKFGLKNGRRQDAESGL